MPDVTWFRVDELPPDSPDDDYFVWGPGRLVEIAVARSNVYADYWEQDGCEVHGITHYAKIELPEPPEEQNA